MAWTVTSLLPYNVQLGGSSGYFNAGGANPGPPAIGDGSVVDDSDATGRELGSSSLETDLIFVDFTMSASQNPVWCYVLVRLRNSPGWTGYAEDGSPLGPLPVMVMQDVGDGTTEIFVNSNWPDPVERGEVSTPTSFGLAYGGPEVPIDSSPSYDNNWLNVVEREPQLAAALTGPGLRVGLGVLSTGTLRHPFVDLFEVRLVVAYESAGRRPRLRKHPISPLRQWPPEPYYGRSNRRAGGYS